MSADDPRWRELPILRELFLQWRPARGSAEPGAFQRSFARNWEALLESAGLVSGEARGEADRDARLLAQAGLVELKLVRYRPYQIERISLPLGAEPRLRALFADELPVPPASPFDFTAVDWQPELSFLRTARTAVAAEDLLKLNDFFAAGGRERLAVPIKERSLEIFGDEKRLDALLNTTLFRGDRLTFEQLRCFRVAEPLGWKRGSRSDGPVLVIENASTWDSYCRWNADHGRLSAVVYGCGNRFADSVSRLGDLFAEFGGRRRVLYFGDLDPQGLRIPLLASGYAKSLGLPAVEADLWSYAKLLEIGRPQKAVIEEEPIPAADFEWLGASATPVRLLFESGQRLAQEHLGWELLTALGDAPRFG